jgi:hypothetical protein
MIRALCLSTLLGLACATAASAQHAVGVSAVIVDAVDVSGAAFDVRSEGERLTARRVGGVLPAGSRVLERTLVSMPAATSAEPALVREGGAVRLEQRELTRGPALEDLWRPAEVVPARSGGGIVVTQVIAANS